MRKTLVLPLAGLLAVSAAGAVLATDGADLGTTGALTAAASTAPDGTAALPDRPKDTLLADVLADLVAKGTITQAQADAITGALRTAHEERHAAREAERAQMREFLADGVITEDEIAQLPADSRIRTLTTLLDDGKITLEELQGLGGFGRGGHGGRGGHHGFGDMDGDGPMGPMAPDASTAPSGSSS